MRRVRRGGSIQQGDLGVCASTFWDWLRCAWRLDTIFPLHPSLSCDDHNMAPMLPKKRRVERPHEIQERASKRIRIDSKRRANAVSASGNTKPASRPSLVRSTDRESSEDEGDGLHDVGVSYGSLLGALNVSNRDISVTSPESRERSKKSQLLQIEPHSRADEVHSADDDADALHNQQSAVNLEVLPQDEPADSDDEDAADPFETQFSAPKHDDFSDRLKCIQHSMWRVEKTTSSLGRELVMFTESDSGNTVPVQRTTFSHVHLKQKLRARGVEELAKCSSATSNLVSNIFTYQDVLYGGRTVANAEDLRVMTCLHALNHVLKTRDKVIKNTSRLAKDTDIALELRDQGFTRPKVLILLETRQMCVHYMEMITRLFAPEQQENRKRFEDAFVQTERISMTDKPLDFRELFEGNDDNEFRLGVKFTRKTIKYYSQFYSSDIIFASPLGLRRALKIDDPKHADSDFLSSIELFVIDQADAMLMQNFEHVERIFEHLNLQPKEAHGCDFSRVRQWYLDGNARHLRQAVVFSNFLTPELNGLFTKHMNNVAGKVKLTPIYPGAIMDIALRIRQTFTRYTSRSPDRDPDDRFKYFVSTIIPLLNRQLPPRRVSEDEVKEPRQGLGALIFIPSYLDFVRIRNYFSTSPDTTNLAFGSISEYTEVAEARRSRSYFLIGRQSVMLYTGRAHHFHRYKIRGVKRVVLYGLPDNPAFYQELVGDFVGQSVEQSLIDSSEVTVRVLFSKYDGLALERIVGSERVGKMMRDGDDTFEFT